MSQGFGIESVDVKTSTPSVSKPKQVADIRRIQQSLVEYFADIEDPRVERTKKHQLTDLLVIAILAIIAGAQGWEDAEDACRIRSFHSPQNFALLRRIALNAFNREQTYKRSVRQKSKRAAMDDDYMIQVLSSCFLAPTLDSSYPLCQA